MEVTNETLQELYAFIRAQEPARVITHSSWASCAVGEFLKMDPDTYGGRHDAADFANAAMILQEGLFTILGGVTYGDMQHDLNEAGL